MDERELANQLGPDYQRLYGSQTELHVQLLNQVRRATDLAIHTEPTGERTWRVTVCCPDYLGMLSLIAGMFTAHELDVVRGDVFTVRDSAMGSSQPLVRGRRRRGIAPPPRGKVLDIFDVAAKVQLEPGWWDQFRAEFAELIKLAGTGRMTEARERVVERVSRAAQAAPAELEAALLPVEVSVDNEKDPNYTILHIYALDTLGFLFEFANALATLNVNISRVEVRTDSGQVLDTFWVTDTAGRKLTDPARLEELRATAALIKQFTHLLPLSPDPAQALRQFRALTGQMLTRPDWVGELHRLGSRTMLRTLAELMGVSQFLWEDFLRMQHENLFPLLDDLPALSHAKSRDELERELRAKLAKYDDLEKKVQKLNEFKDREMFRIDLRHITGRIEFAQFAEELSDLAEAVVSVAAELAHQVVQQRCGSPRLEGGQPCPWLICALGKFGGREIGFASDIELLFVYGGPGHTDGPERVENAQYFHEFVTEFLRTVRSRREGIFEIDLRLRPYGSAGSLASSVDAFQEYFSETGPAQQFERMALVKLRPVAGDRTLAGQVLDARDRFVYSGKPIDYENIRHLRARQAKELVSPGTVNAKYSPGGLVDIEYFIQAKQIEAGAHDPRVRVTSTRRATRLLAEGGHLDRQLAEQILDTYGFMRRLIDALRVVRGHARDLTIPRSGTREFAYLARRLGKSEQELADEIVQRMGFAQRLWEQA